MTIGSRTDGTQNYIGEIDELRIWNSVRTTCQINEYMRTSFTIFPANLVAYYNFNAG